MSFINHLFIPVSNINESSKFYMEKFNLKEKSSLREGENHFSILQTKTEDFYIILLENKELAGKLTVPGLIVKDLNKSMEKMRRENIDFVDQIIDIEYFKYIHFKDPSGNILQLTELKNK